MYFGKNFKKIKKILKEENVVVSSKCDPEGKDILKFVTYELENGERYNSIIDNSYIENVNNAKKFLSKFQKIATLIEDTDFNNDYKELANDIRFEFDTTKPAILPGFDVCNLTFEYVFLALYFLKKS